MDIINTVIVIAAVIMLLINKININVTVTVPDQVVPEPKYTEVQKELDEAYEKEQKQFVDTATAIQNIFTENADTDA